MMAALGRLSFDGRPFRMIRASGHQGRDAATAILFWSNIEYWDRWEQWVAEFEDTLNGLMISLIVISL